MRHLKSVLFADREVRARSKAKVAVGVDDGGGNEQGDDELTASRSLARSHNVTSLCDYGHDRDNNLHWLFKLEAPVNTSLLYKLEYIHYSRS